MSTIVKSHPLGGLGTKNLIIGVATAALGGAIMSTGLLGGAGLIGIGAFYAWTGWRVRRALPGLEAAHRALDAVSRGDHEAARAELDAMNTKTAPRSVLRAVHGARAGIAADQGQWAQVIEHATRAIDGPTGLFTRYREEQQIAIGRSCRALAFAITGDHAAALRDVELLRASRAALPAAHARGALAVAVTLAARDARGELRELFAKDGRLLRDQLTKKERVLGRALSRLAHAKKTSVYREPAKPEEVDPVSAWIASASPSVASHREAPRTRVEAPPNDDAPTPEAIRARDQQAQLGVARATAAYNRSMRWWGALIMVLLVVLVYALCTKLLIPDPTPMAAPHFPSEVPPPSLSSAGVIDSLLVLFTGLFAFSVARQVWRTHAQTRTLAAALNAAVRGDWTAAARELEPMTQGASPQPAAVFQLGQLALREGKYKEALERLDVAHALASRTALARAIAHDILLPGIITERAYCLAALDRFDESRAELASLAKHPTYPLATVSVFHVRLAEALRRGDRARALRLARSRPEGMEVSGRDEMLCDVLEATEGDGVTEDEWSRIDGELSEDTELAAAVEHFLPGARRRLAPRKRIAEAGAVSESESVSDSESVSESESVSDSESESDSALRH